MIVAEEIQIQGVRENTDNQRALELESYLQSHPIIQELRGEKQNHIIESRPYLELPSTLRQNNLTAGFLSSTDKIAVSPLVFADTKKQELSVIIHVGKGLWGHPGYLHGGMLAGFLDEFFAYSGFLAVPHKSLPSKVGTTAELDVNYRAPCTADQFIIIKTSITKVEGKKVWLTGTLETLPEPNDGNKGKLLIEASAQVLLNHED